MQDLGALIDYEYLVRLFNHCPESDMDVVLKKIFIKLFIKFLAVR